MKYITICKTSTLPLYNPSLDLVKTITGFFTTLATLDATIPITPSCQLSPIASIILLSTDTLSRTSFVI